MKVPELFLFWTILFEPKFFRNLEYLFWREILFDYRIAALHWSRNTNKRGLEASCWALPEPRREKVVTYISAEFKLIHPTKTSRTPASADSTLKWITVSIPFSTNFQKSKPNPRTPCYFCSSIDSLGKFNSHSHRRRVRVKISTPTSHRNAPFLYHSRRWRRCCPHSTPCRPATITHHRPNGRRRSFRPHLFSPQAFGV